MYNEREKASRYRANAEEIRMRALTLSDPKLREILLLLAAEYDQLAFTLDELAAFEDSKLQQRRTSA